MFGVDRLNVECIWLCPYGYCLCVCVRVCVCVCLYPTLALPNKLIINDNQCHDICRISHIVYCLSLNRPFGFYCIISVKV